MQFDIAGGFLENASEDPRLSEICFTDKDEQE